MMGKDTAVWMSFTDTILPAPTRYSGRGAHPASIVMSILAIDRPFKATVRVELPLPTGELSVLRIIHIPEKYLNVETDWKVHTKRY